MARYVVNTRTRKIHDADCNFAGRLIVPWPRFANDGDKACRNCLSAQIPAKVAR